MASSSLEPSELLIVDDSPVYREILSTYFEARGQRVRLATTGEEAVAEVERVRPDLLLLDVNLPGIDGFEVCRRLRERWAAESLPVLFLSAAREAEPRITAFSSGGVDFVSKMANLAEVGARVDLHLELQRRTRALEETNRRLRAVEEHRRRFFTSLVHDIKNPLTPLIKNTEWLLTQPHADEEVVEGMRDAHVAAKHLERMVHSLLDLARAEEWQLPVRREAVFLDRWLQASLQVTRLQLRSTPHRLQARADGASVTIDPTLMARVVQNTVDNALKYSPRSEPVTIDASVQGGRLRIMVEDRGRGVRVEDRERIFASWVRVDERDAEATTSHGIGLAFCRQAVEAHGGTMTVEDAQPKGARFVIELPQG